MIFIIVFVIYFLTNAENLRGLGIWMKQYKGVGIQLLWESKIYFISIGMLIFNLLAKEVSLIIPWVPLLKAESSEYWKGDGKNSNVIQEISSSHSNKTFDFSLKLILRFLTWGIHGRIRLLWTFSRQEIEVFLLQGLSHL